MNMKNITTGPSPGSGFAIQPLPQDTKAPLVIGIASMFIAVTAVFVAVRIYIRGYLMRGWGRDDSMFAATAFFIVAQGVAVILNTTDGTLGDHIWNASLNDVAANTHYLIATVLLYQVSFAAAKVTVLLQYRRAFAIRSVRIFCDVFLAIVLVFMAAMLISGGLIMRVFQRPDYMPGDGQTGFLAFGYVNAALHLFTDIVIFILPLPLVGRLQLATMQKVGLIVSFGVGIFTGAISVLRIASLPSGVDTKDPFYEAVPLVLLSLAEPTSALVCACVPILRPLLTSAGASRYSNQSSSSSRRPLPSGSTANGAATPSMPSSPTRPEMARVRSIGGSIRVASLSDGRNSVKRELDGRVRRPSSSEMA